MLTSEREWDVFDKSCHAQGNGWWQVSFTLRNPVRIPLGARFQLGEHRLAIWKQEGERVSCLVTPSANPPDLTQPLCLHHHGAALPEFSTEETLLITGKALGIADALRFCHEQPNLAPNALILLSADTFPFVIKPARFMVSLIPEAIGACPLLEDWGFANRLFSLHSPIGCYDSEMETWLQQHQILVNSRYQRQLMWQA
jgi:hypothetical protein